MRAYIYLTCLSVVACGSSDALSIGENDDAGGSLPGVDGGSNNSEEGEDTKDGGESERPVTATCDPGPMPEGKSLCGRTLQTPIKLADFNVSELATAGRNGSFISVVNSQAGMVSRYVDGVGWLSPVTVGGGDRKAGWILGAGASGDVLALWSEQAETGSTLWTRRFDGTSWAEATSHGKVASSYSVGLGTASNGAAIATWFSEPSKKGMLALFDPASGWSQPSEVDVIPPLRGSIDATGNAGAIWTKQPQGSFDQLPYVSRRPSGSTWTAEAPLTTGASPITSRDSQIAAYGDGKLVALWLEYKSGRIYAQRFEPASGWSAPQTLQENVGKNPNLRVYVDDTGKGFAFWSQAGTDKLTPYMARFDSATGFSTPTAIAGKLQAVDVAEGRVILAWHANDSIFASCYEGAWSNPITVSKVTPVKGSPPAVSVAIAKSGAAAITWSGADGICASNLR